MYEKCDNCGGDLIPNLDTEEKEFYFVCENKEEKKCIPITLPPSYKETIMELRKWNLNDFDIYDLLKYGAESSRMLDCIAFINKLNIVVYKRRVLILKSLLLMPFYSTLNRFIIKFKFKFRFLYIIVYSLIIIILSFLILVAYNMFYVDNESKFLEMIKNDGYNKVPIEEPVDEVVLIDEVNNDNEKIIDTDADGISDADEISIYKTDPNKTDTDGDGYNDKDEIDHGYDPLK